MAIELIDGTKLPDIPTVYDSEGDENAPVLSELKYRAVFYESAHGTYNLVFCSKPYAYLASENRFLPTDALVMDDSVYHEPHVYFQFWGEPGEDCSNEDDWGTWELSGWDNLNIAVSLWTADVYKPQWTNHNIRTITEVTADSKIVWSNELYFANPKPNIMLRDKTALLEFPAGLITEEHPYAVICCEADEVCSEFYAFATSEPFSLCDDTLVSPCDKGMDAYLCIYDGYIETDGWELDEYDGPRLTRYPLAWSNHDIFVATDPNGDNDWADMVATDELYFPAAVDEPIALPNGTVLSAPPVIAGHPYVSIFNIDLVNQSPATHIGYAVMLTPKPIWHTPEEDYIGCFVISEAEDSDYIEYGTTIDTQYSSWAENNLVNDSWGLPEYNGLFSSELVWANHDVYEAPYFDGWNLEPSTELYFASSVAKPEPEPEPEPEAPPEFLCETYSWFRKLGDVFRRSSGVSGVFMTLPDIENIFKLGGAVEDASLATLVDDQKLVALRTPTLSLLAPYALAYRDNLRYVDLGETSVMYTCSLWGTDNLETLILRSPTVCTVRSFSPFPQYVLYQSAIDYDRGYIYVPKSLVDSYKSNSSWSKHSTQFRAIEDYPEVCNPA